MSTEHPDRNAVALFDAWAKQFSQSKEARAGLIVTLARVARGERVRWDDLSKAERSIWRHITRASQLTGDTQSAAKPQKKAAPHLAVVNRLGDDGY